LKGCGIYAFDLPIFDAIRRTPRTAQRDEYEITSSIQILIDDGYPVYPAEIVSTDINLTIASDLLRANVTGTGNLLDAVLREAPGARVLVVGSSAEYGYAGTDPIGEGAPLRPVTPYGVSKAAQTLLALSYHALYGLPVAVAVPFNLVGPGLPASFVGGRIVAQALEVSRGERSAVELRGIDARRDFVDVRDAAAAYLAVLCADRFEERVAGQKVNVGSGTSRSVAELLEVVRRVLGTPIRVELPESPSPDPVPAQTADIGRIMDLTGWSPRIAFETSVRDMLDLSTTG
jgi:GDP-4-dehydro-6-deoxy-D-mannose reductase